MNMNLLKSGKTRTKMFALISVSGVILALLLNLLLTYVGLHKTVFVDLTPEELYTATDRLCEELEFVDKDLSGKVKITFCADPDTLMESDTARLTYVMALKLANKFKNIEVSAESIVYKPTLVDKYKANALTKITTSHVIISYGDRYRIIGLDNFWVASSDVLFAYNGEYKMASIIKSVTATERPKAYFVTDHGETYYTPDDKSEGWEDVTELYNLLTDRGLEVKTLKLSEIGEIPADCELLVINNPREDYTSTPSEEENTLGYRSETEKLDRYLTKGHGSIMIAKDYEITLPTLESFLYEWGFEFVDAKVSDKGAYLPTEDGDYTTVLGQYDTNEDSYAYAIYGEYASLSSRPNMVFKNTGYLTCSYGIGTTSPEPGTYAVTRNYDPFFYTTDKAEAYKKDGGIYSADEVLHLAAVSSRLEINTVTAEYKYSYIMCAPSADFFSNEILGEASNANFDILSALVENMARSDEYASMDLGGISGNSEKLGGKQLLDMTIYSASGTSADTTKELLTDGAQTAFVVIIMLIPVALATFGVVIYVKRKNL